MAAKNPAGKPAGGTGKGAGKAPAEKKSAAKKPGASKQPEMAGTRKGGGRAPVAKPASVSVLRPGGFPVVGIGASAGGLEAFEAFFKAMPHDSGMAFVLVAHLDPTHVSILPELLQKRTKMAVFQAADGMRVEPNSVYVIPPNKALSILNGVLQLMETAQPRGVNLPIDGFFRALAQDQGASAICIILSGTGTDGTLGLKAVKGALGMVMVQDEDSAKYDGMPRSAVATGLADYVLPPTEMPEQLVKYVRHAAYKPAPAVAPVQGKVPNALQKIFLVLRARTGHDFSLYKKNTICRRIERRMNVHQIDDISDYVRYVQESDREAGVLFKELLIGVTNFFRDADGFEALQQKALLKMLRGRGEECTVRVWVPGCSSGEEAYSLAILLQESMEQIKCHLNVQIFATDIDADAIATARAGLYPGSIVADVGPQRLKRCFIKEDDGQYRIKKTIREMLVFALQNIIKDPPFTKLDLLSCRNLLIYLGPELQRKLLPIFHYSLVSGGVLFLGSSETIGPDTDLFETLDKKWKIFRRKPTSLAAHPLLQFPTALAPPDGPDPKVLDAVQQAEQLSALQLVQTILQQSDTPPCAIVDDAANIIYVHGRTGRYLEPAQGRVSVNIVEMARPGLKAELAAAIRKVTLRKLEVTENALRVQYNGGHLFVDLTVKPILEQSGMRGLLMVVFAEATAPTKTAPAKAKRAAPKARGKTAEELEQDLQYTRENLQTTIEELETSNEELKSTNEELQSTNEELQSTNEEMETSKEELQSLNEESATVNAELQSRIEELSKANDDMKNLLDSTEIATIFLDTELGVRRFTPQATQIIPLVGTDSGRPIKHFASNLVGVDLADRAEQVLKDLAVQELEVRSKDDRYYLLRVRPYRTTTNVIDGVVMTFEDVTARRAVEREAGILARFPSENPHPVMRIGRGGTVLYANPASEPLLRAWNSEVGGAAPEQLCQLVADAFRTGSPTHADVKHGDRVLSFEVVPLVDADYANIYGNDITASREADCESGREIARLEKTVHDMEARPKDATR